MAEARPRVYVASVSAEEIVSSLWWLVLSPLVTLVWWWIDLLVVTGGVT